MNTFAQTITSPSVRYDIVVGALAATAGVHAALAHDHGHSFTVAAVAAGAAAFALAVRPARLVLVAAALLLGALLVAYLAAGDGPDAVALGTKGVEAAGLVAALSVVRRPPAEAGITPLPLATLVGFFAALLVVGGGHGHAG